MSRKETRFVVCPICNKKFKQLAQHLLRVHGIKDPKRYAEENEINLVAESVRNKMSRARHEYFKNNPEAVEKSVAQLREGFYENEDRARKRMSESLKGKSKSHEHRKHIAKAKQGDKNPMKRPEVKAEVSNTMKYKWTHDIEFILKMNQVAEQKSISMKEDNPMFKPEVKTRHRDAVSSEEYKEKQSERMKEVWKDPERSKNIREGLKKARKEGKLSKGTYKMLSIYGNKFILEAQKTHIHKLRTNPDYYEDWINSMKEGWANKPDSREAVRQFLLSRDDLEEFIESGWSALGTKPTSLEKKLIDIVEKYNFPFRYVGNGQKWIKTPSGRLRCPDFIDDKETMVILVDGEYWHDEELDKVETNDYIESNYSVMRIKESELSNERKVRDKINELVWRDNYEC